MQSVFLDWYIVLVVLRIAWGLERGKLDVLVGWRGCLEREVLGGG